MADETTYTVELSPSELGVVASLLDLPGLVGIEDPFEGLDKDEETSALEQSRDSLVAKGLLQMGDHETAVLDGALAAMVQAVGTASQVLALASATGEKEKPPRLVFCEGDGGLIVEQEAFEDDVSLTAVMDLEILRDRMLAYLAVPVGPVAPGDSVSLGAETLAEARRLALEGDAIDVLLRDAGVPDTSIGALKAALAPSAVAGSASLSMLPSMGDGPFSEEVSEGGSVGWLASPEACYRVEPGEGDDSQQVVLTPASSEAIEKAVHSLLAVLK